MRTISGTGMNNPFTVCNTKAKVAGRPRGTSMGIVDRKSTVHVATTDSLGNVVGICSVSKNGMCSRSMSLGGAAMGLPGKVCLMGVALTGRAVARGIVI